MVTLRLWVGDALAIAEGLAVAVDAAADDAVFGLVPVLLRVATHVAHDPIAAATTTARACLVDGFIVIFLVPFSRWPHTSAGTLPPP
jgi:hypothetical protein